jgi:hypothetical protein
MPQRQTFRRTVQHAQAIAATEHAEPAGEKVRVTGSTQLGAPHRRDGGVQTAAHTVQIIATIGVRASAIHDVSPHNRL